MIVQVGMMSEPQLVCFMIFMIVQRLVMIRCPLGWDLYIAAFTATSYSNHPAFSSIFSYLAELKSQQQADATAIETFAAARGINSTENYGAWRNK